MRSFFFLPFYFFIFISCSSPPPEDPSGKNAAPAIQLGGTSYVQVELKNVQDTVRVNSSYWPVLLSITEYFTEDYTLAKDTTILLSFDISVPSKHSLNIGAQQAIPLFLVPSDTLRLTADFSADAAKGTIAYTGKYANINRYLHNKPADLAANMKGAHFFNNPYHSKTPEETLWQHKAYTDSIVQLQHHYLKQSKGSYQLPDWFVEYEQNQAKLNAAYSQKTILTNWKFTYQLELEPPTGYLQSIAQPAFLYPTSLYSYLFYPYLNIFVQEIAEKRGVKIKEENRRFLLPEEYKIQIEVADSLLTNKQLLAGYLSAHFFINTRGVLHKHGAQYLPLLKNLVQDPSYLSFIENKHEELFSGLLPKGTRAPSFYLLSHENEQYVSLPDFEGKLLLLNFWFPGCKPCIKEVPHEKRLL